MKQHPYFLHRFAIYPKNTLKFSMLSIALAGQICYDGAQIEDFQVHPVT